MTTQNEQLIEIRKLHNVCVMCAMPATYTFMQEKGYLTFCKLHKKEIFSSGIIEEIGTQSLEEAKKVFSSFEKPFIKQVQNDLAKRIFEKIENLFRKKGIEPIYWMEIEEIKCEFVKK